MNSIINPKKMLARSKSNASVLIHVTMSVHDYATF